jgi:hypothetical protein
MKLDFSQITSSIKKITVFQKLESENKVLEYIEAFGLDLAEILKFASNFQVFRKTDK